MAKIKTVKQDKRMIAGLIGLFVGVALTLLVTSFAAPKRTTSTNNVSCNGPTYETRISSNQAHQFQYVGSGDYCYLTASIAWNGNKGDYSIKLTSPEGESRTFNTRSATQYFEFAFWDKPLTTGSWTVEAVGQDGVQLSLKVRASDGSGS